MHSSISLKGLGEERDGPWKAYQPSIILPPVCIRDPALPLVSITTPSYNQGKFIRETIASVLTQRYPNIEYWVIDGGSTDNTREILREYEHDPRFHWISEPDEGQADAINKGWARSRGDIVCWLNSDDTYIGNGVIETQIALLRSSPSIGLVYGSGYFTDTQGRELRTFTTRPYSYPALLRTGYIVQPTVFLKRAVVQEVGPLDTTFRFAMDHNYWLRCTAVTTMRESPNLVATYRLHGESKTVSEPIEINVDTTWAVCLHLAKEGRRMTTPEQRRRIMASLLLSLAARAIRGRDMGYARQLVTGARQLTLFNVRYLYLPIVLLGNKWGGGIEEAFAERIYALLQSRLQRRATKKR